MMSASWTRSHSRYVLLHAVLDSVAAQEEPTVPVELRAAVFAEFGSIDGLLCAVQYHWYRIFDAQLDQLLEREPADIEAAVAALWDSVAAQRPAARRLLDANAGNPALVAGDNHHRATLYTATGVDQFEVARTGRRVMGRVS